MLTPSDLIGTLLPSLGQASQTAANPTLGSVVGIISNTGRGVYTMADLVAKLQALKAGAPAGSGPDLSQLITIYTNTGVPSLGASTAAAQMSVGPTGATVNVTSLAQIIGADFTIPTGHPAATMPVGVILSKSPFFSPQVRNTHRAEIFLNSMPNTVLAQLIPFMQVEFQSQRPGQVDAIANGSMGLLKFLEGAQMVSGMGTADNAMFEAHQVAGTSAAVAPATVAPTLNYAGMEMFTAPQTLTNPTPNSETGTDGARYVDVLDPYKPFASLEHVNIAVKPAGHGFQTYKNASMTIKLHDRSRLSEIADLLRVDIFTGVTIWMTYGWRAPVRPGANPYFDYVNDNLLVREAYGIYNSSFSFDDLGQVIITLQCMTKAVAELRAIKITSQFGDTVYDNKQLSNVVKLINEYAQKLHNLPDTGLSKDVRVAQVLEAAESGQFPDLSPADTQTAIAKLYSALSGIGAASQSDLQTLQTNMKTLYAPATGDPSKFVYKERYLNLQTQTISKMFNEVATGADPFLPVSIKNAGASKTVGAAIAAINDALNAAPTNKAPTAQATVVSFGKIFNVFAMRGILSLPPGTVDEIQIFFYNLNSQCGPIGGHNVAEFPINLSDFQSQFQDFAKSKGVESITMEDFLELCINAQFNDKRAIGYGVRDCYAPYKTGAEPTYVAGPNAEGTVNSRVDALAQQYGPFKFPQIEMFVEVSHQRVSSSGQNDVLTALAYQSTTASSITPSAAQAYAAKKILRYHIYDKAMVPNDMAATLLRSKNNDSFILQQPNQDPVPAAASPSIQSGLTALQTAMVAAVSTIPGSTPPGGSFTVDPTTNQVSIPPFSSNQQIKDVISKFVPTIKFGANGSTITKASLTSKADPKVGTNNLINSQNNINTAHPNGSGDLGIPLRVFPAQLTMTSLGCPLACGAQQYFIDFNTGTTLDNLYILTHFTHDFSPGKFETNWTFGYSDGYGTYEGAPNVVDAVANTKATLSGPTPGG